MARPPTSRLANRLRGLAILLVLLAIAGEAEAQRRIAYQGRVQGTSGQISVVFEILSEAVVIWGPEQHLVNPDGQGNFITVIGSTNLDDPPGAPGANGTADLDEITDAQLQSNLRLRVSIASGGSPSVMLSPLQLLLPAFHARSAATVLDSAITSAKIANGSILSVDVQDETLTAADLAVSSVGTSEILDQSVAASDLYPIQVVSLSRPGTVPAEIYHFDPPSTPTQRMISWQTEVDDTDNMWANTAPRHVIVRTAGYYLVALNGIKVVPGSTMNAVNSNFAARIVRDANPQPGDDDLPDPNDITLAQGFWETGPWANNPPAGTAGLGKCLETLSAVAFLNVGDEITADISISPSICSGCFYGCAGAGTPGTGTETTLQVIRLR